MERKLGRLVFESKNSIKIDLFTPCTIDTSRPNIPKLLRSGCRKWRLQIDNADTIEYPNCVKFVTSLRCHVSLVQKILESKSSRLTTLEVIIDLVNGTDIKMFGDAYDQLMAWCHVKDHGKRKNKSIVTIRFVGFRKEVTLRVQVVHMVILMKLHKNEDFDFELNDSHNPSRYYPFAQCVYPLLSNSFIDSVAFQTTMDAAGLKAIPFVDGATRLKNLFLELVESTGKSTTVSFTISNPSISHIHLCSKPGPQLDPCFEHLPSLKELNLYDCTVTVECINSLPRSLAKLTLIDFDFGNSSCFRNVIEGGDGYGGRRYNYDWRGFEQLSLDKLACLDRLSFSFIGQMDSFDLSALPDSYDLYFTAPYELSGQFSSKLESLDLDLVEYDENFESFWKKFIFPLEKHVLLKS
ncbi:unnamed protein product [Ambrosiozyma monospora]|uniref:Unnamed protein product n=1 Tax=Ambrosiozyma monospora TaxID=43982 RepID=A0ACB5SR32_AMBMO|nr:unnamed protein product [Ambrosiozyma monospora]